MKDIAKALSLGFLVIANLLLGFGLGYFLDQWLNFSPVFMILGLLCGTAGAFMTLYAMGKKNETRS